MNHTWTYNLSFDAPGDPVEPRAGLSRNGHTIVAVFLGFILFFGFLNNLIVLILFCKFKTLRNPVNMLLLNISISDMLVCISGTTLSFASNIHGKWIGGEHGCRWYGFVNSCFGKSSLIILLSYSFQHRCMKPLNELVVSWCKVNRRMLWFPCYGKPREIHGLKHLTAGFMKHRREMINIP